MADYPQLRGQTIIAQLSALGWIISPLLSALLSLGMFAYYLGGVNSEIKAMKEDISILKQEIFELSHITRGFGGGSQR